MAVRAAGPRAALWNVPGATSALTICIPRYLDNNFSRRGDAAERTDRVIPDLYFLPRVVAPRLLTLAERSPRKDLGWDARRPRVVFRGTRERGRQAGCAEGGSTFGIGRSLWMEAMTLRIPFVKEA